MLTVHDLLAAPPPARADDYLIYPWLQAGRVCLMVGPTEIGKTTLTLELIAACLEDRLLWNRYPTKRIEKVLYLHAEHSLATIQEAAQKRGDLPLEHVFIVHDFGPLGSALIDNGKPNVTLLREIITACETVKPQLIVVEPLSAFLGTSENDNKEVRQLINILVSLATRFNAAMLMHHHPGKVHYDPDRFRPKGIAVGEARGAMAFEDASERVIYLRREKDNITLETPKPKGYPIAPVTLKRDNDTLRYHCITPSGTPDVCGLLAYLLEHRCPIEDAVQTLHKTWRCTPGFVRQVARRCQTLGLVDDAYKPLFLTVPCTSVEMPQ